VWVKIKISRKTIAKDIVWGIIKNALFLQYTVVGVPVSDNNNNNNTIKLTRMKPESASPSIKQMI
jgi:hypothetical protein